MNTRPRVVFIKCDSYDTTDHAVSRLFELIESDQPFCRKGQKILLKPNLLTDRHPDNAATTHPALLKSIAREIKKREATPLIGDSPASANKIQSVLEKTGILALSSEEGIGLINMEESGSVFFEHGNFQFTISKAVLECDVLINVPKFKTHSLTTITAAVKNLYGTVPGYQKTIFHRNYPDIRTFSELLNAIAEKVPVSFNIIDAIVGMEGNGPSAGTPKHFNFIAGCKDPYELDYFLCLLLGIPISNVPYLRYKKGKSLPSSIKEMNVVGDTDWIPHVPKCSVPSTFLIDLIPPYLGKILKSLIWIRPFIDQTKCQKCMKCVKACPVSAWQIKNQSYPPSLSQEKCIGCCCCHEVCPANAITMRPSPFLRFIRKGRMP